MAATRTEPGMRVVRLTETEIVKFGPDSVYRPIPG